MIEKIIKIGSLIISFSLLIFFLVRFSMIQFKKSPLDLEEIKKEDSEIHKLVDKTIEEIELKKIEKIKNIDSMDRVIKLKTQELNKMESQYNITETNKKRLSEEIDNLSNKLEKLSEKNDNMLLETLKLTKENTELKIKLVDQYEVEIIDDMPTVIYDTVYITIYQRDTVYLPKKDFKKNKK